MDWEIGRITMTIDKVTQVEAYEKDVKDLDEMVPSNDSFADKFKVVLTLLRGYEDRLARGG
jgi:hypothetical protein